MNIAIIKLLKIIFILFPFGLISVEGNADVRKNIWFLGGHMQHLFEEEYLKPLLNAGYDLTPMHDIKICAVKEGFNILMGDPNATSLSPFSHERSGIPEIENQKQKLSHSELAGALKKFEYIIVFEVMPHQLEYLKQYPKEKLILFLWEPPSVMPQNYSPKNHEIFSKVYTWNDLLVDNEKYYKFSYPVLHPMITEVIPFESKKLCTIVAGNRTSTYPTELYTTRRNLIDFFEKHHPADFDLYGKWWPSFYYQTYKGPVDSKIDCLKNYKFCFAYENVKNIPGYITEKIFDCFQAGCVPVYLGASNIKDYVPSNCFVDRNDFKDNETLYTFLKTMPKEQYDEYIKNIRIYLDSKEAQIFSRTHFINVVMKQIKEPVVKPHHAL